MPEEKPVFVYIKGADLKTPTYNEIMEAKVACEAAGQKFLLIPEPNRDENGNYIKNKDGEYTPVVPLNDVSLRYVKKALKSSLTKTDEDIYEQYGDYREDEEYEDEKFTLYSAHHGLIKNGAHVDLYGDGKIVDSSKLFDTIVNIKGYDGENLCIGIIDISCFGGGSVVELAESLNRNDIQNDIHFLSVAPFDRSAIIKDEKVFIKKLGELAQDNIPFTAENLKKAYLETAGDKHDAIDPTLTERVFKAGEKYNLKNIAYENFDNKLQYIFDNYQNIKTTYADKEEWQVFFQAIEEYPKSNKTIHNLKNDLYDLTDLSSTDLNYPDILSLAEDIYDDFAQKTSDVAVNNSSISTTLLNLYSEKFNELKKLPPEDRYSNLIQLANSDISAGEVLVANIGKWEKFVSAEQKNEIIGLISNHPSNESSLVLLQNYSLLKEHLNEDDLRTHLLNSLQKANTATSSTHLQFYNIIEESLGAEPAKELIKDAALNLAKINGYELFHDRNSIWLEVLDEDKIITIINPIFSGNTFSYHSQWVDHVSKEAEKEIINNAAESEDILNFIFDHYELLKANLSDETLKELFDRKLDFSTPSVSSEFLSHYDIWSKYAAEELRNKVLEVQFNSTHTSFDVILETFPKWREDVEENRRTSLVKNSFKKLATSDPTIVLKKAADFNDALDFIKTEDFLESSILSYTSDAELSSDISEMLSNIENPQLAETIYKKLSDLIGKIKPSDNNIMPHLETADSPNQYLNLNNHKPAIVIASDADNTVISNANDTLRGGAGKDDFVIRKDSGGKTVIKDFNPEEDQVYFIKGNQSHHVTEQSIDDAKILLSEAKIDSIDNVDKDGNLVVSFKQSVLSKKQTIEFDGTGYPSTADGVSKLQEFFEGLGIEILEISDNKLSPPLQSFKKYFSQQDQKDKER